MLSPANTNTSRPFTREVSVKGGAPHRYLTGGREVLVFAGLSARSLLEEVQRYLLCDVLPHNLHRHSYIQVLVGATHNVAYHTDARDIVQLYQGQVIRNLVSKVAVEGLVAL